MKPFNRSQPPLPPCPLDDPRATPREQAIYIVTAFLETDAFPDREMEKMRVRHAATMEIAYGVIRHLAIMRWLMNEFTDRPPREPTQACLFCGFYELFYMRSEAYAVLNETVESAKRVLSYREAGFVNALLRRALERKDELQEEIERLPPPLRLSHPEPLWCRWVMAFGEEKAEALCRWNNEPPHVVIFPDPGKIKLDRYLNLLAERSIGATRHPFDPECLQLDHGTPIHRLPGYDEGWFTVQDPATSLAVNMMEARPGETLLDACAAPGGKTLLLARAMQQSGTIVAMDIFDDRLDTLRRNLRRAGCTIVRVVPGDARSLGADSPAVKIAPDGGFDGILLDVPCSNTGVLRRRPDARWRFNKARLADLQRTQRTLLQSVARFLRPGGRLVYSTCSLEPEENLDLLKKWLLHSPEYELAGHRQLFPPETGTDGAFVALLRKHA